PNIVSRFRPSSGQSRGGDADTHPSDSADIDVPSIIEIADRCRLWNIVQQDLPCTWPWRMRPGDNYVLERRARHYLRAVGIGDARGLVDSDLLSIVSIDDRQSWTAGALGAFSA